MTYDFLVDTYATERIKVLTVWSSFADSDLEFRPAPAARSVREQMVHQCQSEDLWFRAMFGIDLGKPPLPAQETRLAFLNAYAEQSARRLEALRSKEAGWWEAEVAFFDEFRTRAWIMVRRISHTSHHRGQQTTMLRLLERQLYSTYGPTADTGGLMRDAAPVIYAYPDVDALVEGETRASGKRPLPGPGARTVTERP